MTRRLLVPLFLAAVLAACVRPALDLPEFDPLEPAPPAEVEAVLFLVGDAGEAIDGRSPVMAKLEQDVEQWSRDLATDSAVSVAYLGDIVYPDGLHERGHPSYPADSARLWTQIEIVGGPAAIEFESTAWFLAGNHDWGQMQGDDAIERVLNLGEALAAANEAGRNVTLVPPAGSPGPVWRDVRDNIRLVALDTHWFLQERAEPAKDEFFRRVTEALVEAGDREVIFLAHHPYRSGGPHGALVATARALGIGYLLKKSGTLIQDLNSPVYQDFLERLDRAIAEAGRPPLIFAGGHDHSLQVLVGDGPRDPRYSLVSGSASKLTEVSQVPNLIYAAPDPGYMMLVFRDDDAVELYVKAVDPSLQHCRQTAEAERVRCMEEGVEAFEVIYSRLLLPAGGSTAPAERGSS